MSNQTLNANFLLRTNSPLNFVETISKPDAWLESSEFIPEHACF
jgi:hypothetical protein